MISDMAMFLDRMGACASDTDDPSYDDIWTLEVNFVGAEPSRFVLSLSADKTPAQLANDFRAFATTLEFGITGEWH